MNFTTIKGRLTRDPELRVAGSDLKIATFSVAVPRKYNREKVDFFDCKAFRKQAEVISTHFTKGKEILISGHMEQSKWTDKNGATRVSWELVVEDFEFCGNKGESAPAPVVDAAPFEGMEGTPFEMVDDFADIADLPA